MPLTITPATDAQVRFLNSLRVERGLAELTADEANVLDKRNASREIDRVKALPRPARPTNRPNPLGDLPLCKYLVTGDAGQRVHVEVVERRNGRRFVNVLIGAPGDWRRQEVSYATQMGLATKIRTATYTDRVELATGWVVRDLQGPEAAAVRFSREHKCCSACMSPLSDETQPGYAFGLGPVCRTRFGH